MQCSKAVFLRKGKWTCALRHDKDPKTLYKVGTQ